MTDNNNWISYDSSRLCKFLQNGKIVVVKPKDYSPTPLFCSECLFPIKTLEDVLALREFSCCSQCKLYFASTRAEEWKEKGWRMDKNSDQWKEYLELRNLRAKTIISFK
jgi:hypothetical protein